MTDHAGGLHGVLSDWVAHGRADAALQGACLGLVAGGCMGLDALGHVASALAAGAAAIALRVGSVRRMDRHLPYPDWMDRELDVEALVAAGAARLRPSGLDAAFLDGLCAAGPVSERRGGAWLVHDGSGSGPRVMADREYARWRREQPDLVEVEPSPGCTKVSRLSMGRLDSLRTGLPALEMLGEGDVALARTWFLDGRPSDLAAVEDARAGSGLDRGPATDDDPNPGAWGAIHRR